MGKRLARYVKAHTKTNLTLFYNVSHGYKYRPLRMVIYNIHNFTYIMHKLYKKKVVEM